MHLTIVVRKDFNQLLVMNVVAVTIAEIVAMLAIVMVVTVVRVVTFLAIVRKC